MTEPTAPLVIVGTGAMACLFAARLAPHVDVCMLGTWKEGVEALQHSGVELIDSDGSLIRHAVRATRDPMQCVGAGMALVLVKSWQTERAAKQLATCLAPGGIALTLQNGLGNLEGLQDVLGVERAALGVTTSGATLLQPGRVRMGGKGLVQLPSDQRLTLFKALLAQAEFDVQISSDLQGMLWTKLLVNAGINPLTALLDVPNGALLERPDAMALMMQAAEETAAVAQACGIQISHENPGELAAQVAHRTAENISSMLQDVRRGAPTEIDAICGAIVRTGTIVQVEAPVNRTLWHLVQALVWQGEGEAS